MKAKIERLKFEGIINIVRQLEYVTQIIPALKEDKTVRFRGDFKVIINPQLAVEEYLITNVDRIL